MEGVEESAGDREVTDKKEGPRLMERAKRERWHIPGSSRGPMIDRLIRIIDDESSPNREVLAAVGALLAASKINLANISLMIKVHEYEELEQRMTELESQFEAETGGQRAPGLEMIA